MRELSSEERRCVLFVHEFVKAFVRVDRDVLSNGLRVYGVDRTWLRSVQSLYMGS